MLAMDVVDTLRHRDALVERELGADARDEALLERLKALYASQGMEVSEETLARGVAALRENRFAYRPPEPGLALTLARLYVDRGRWGRWLLGGAGAVLVGWVGYQALWVWPAAREAAEQARSREAVSQALVALPARIDAAHDAAAGLARVDEALALAERHRDDARAALRAGDSAGASAALAHLEALRETLAREYELRIVSRPEERSGVWRVPEDNPSARNYYLIVEAVAGNGERLKVAVTNEEDARVETVIQWGMRVSESTFERVAADKRDDGIIQNNRFGVKRRGHLEPEYLFPTTGAALTRW
jgi:hypothetical protein